MINDNSLQGEVTAAIYRAIDEINEQRPASKQVEKAPDTVLFGREGGLDSLSLVNLLVAIEKHLKLGHATAVPFSIPDMLLGQDNPFSDVRSLENYIVSLAEED